MQQTQSQELNPVRRSLFPQEGDSWASIAAREFPDADVESCVAELQSWNLHVFMRAAVGGAEHPILPSDVVFLEPPLAQG